ncbi:hypothetical protein [Methylocapsa sp. S129]|nr:hypothetical protein [Methylocapsa sp. S129]
MTLKQTRLVTTDVAKLTRFYETVSQSKAEILSVRLETSRFE